MMRRRVGPAGWVLAAMAFAAVAHAEAPPAVPPPQAAPPAAPVPPPAKPAPPPALAATPTAPALATGETRPLPEDEYHPLASFDWRGFRLEVPVLLAGRAETVSSFAVDRAGNNFQSGVALSPLARIGLRVETVTPLAKAILLFAEYEHDLPTGTWTSDTPVAGEGLPNQTPLTTELRKGWAGAAIGRYLQVGGGFMTSHWGMGLVANDGAHGWEPGSARFTDPRNGALVLRGFVATGPLTKARLVALVAVDKVRSDAVLLPGDSAYQIIASALVGSDQPTQGGFFLVHRRQTAADGRTLDITVVDFAGRVGVKMRKAVLTLEAEGAAIFGATTLGASPAIPSAEVLEFGAVVRASLAFPRAGGVLDLIYASGDDNTHDSRVTGFHADPNFQTGLLLFSYVQAAQTGRGYGTAADPQLVGAPPAGAERIPTRGGLTDAIVAFPRLWVRPFRGLETYGGVLLAFAPQKNIDPFNTDLAGGAPRNALGGDPGSYWGTEFDLGVRYRVYLHHTELTAGVEAGLLLPGSALRDAAGNEPGPIYGGRLMLTYRL